MLPGSSPRVGGHIGQTSSGLAEPTTVENTSDHPIPSHDSSHQIPLGDLSGEILGNLAESHRQSAPSNVSHPNSAFSMHLQSLQGRQVVGPQHARDPRSASASLKPVSIKYFGSSSVTIHLDPEALGGSGQFKKFTPNEGAAELVAEALARSGFEISPKQVTPQFIKSLHGAATRGGEVKRKDVPEEILGVISEGPKSAGKSDAPRSIKAQLQDAHPGDMAGLREMFHGDIPRENRYLVALVNRQTLGPEATFLADNLGIPRENIINKKTSLQEISDDEKGCAMKGRTAAAWTDIMERLRDKTDCSVTIVGHYHAGGDIGPLGKSHEVPETIGGFSVERMAQALGGSVAGGRLNFFSCNSRQFGEEVARAISGSQGGSKIHLNAVKDQVEIQPHKILKLDEEESKLESQASLTKNVGYEIPFYYAGKPLKSDGGRGDAPSTFGEQHSPIAPAFVSSIIGK